MANTKLPSAFRSSDHKDMNDYTPIPGGDYVAHIVESEMKEAKKSVNGNRKMLKCTFEVLQGEHKGKKIWVNLNLINPSKQAVEIAQAELGTIARAAFGHDVVVEDSTILHAKPMILSVKFVPATSTQPAANEVTFYKHMGATGTGAQQVDPFEGKTEKEGETTSEAAGESAQDTGNESEPAKEQQDLKSTPWKQK